jgi:hypothetical protein
MRRIHRLNLHDISIAAHVVHFATDNLTILLQKVILTFYRNTMSTQTTVLLVQSSVGIGLRCGTNVAYEKQNIRY